MFQIVKPSLTAEEQKKVLIITEIRMVKNYVMKQSVGFYTVPIREENVFKIQQKKPAI
jgi:hypothetical protein